MKTYILNQKIISSLLTLFILLLICSLNSNAKNYTWTGTTDTCWNKAANWNLNNLFPGVNDTISIGSTTNHPSLDSIRSVYKMSMTANTLNLCGNTLTTSNYFVISGGTIKSGTLITNGSRGSFSGGTLSVTVSGSADLIIISGSTFNNKVNLTNAGTSSTYGSGGSTFNDSVTFTKASTSTGYWSVANTTGNTYNAPVKFINHSSHALYAGNAATSYFNDNITVGSDYQDIVVGYSVLADGKTIQLDALGFTGTLVFTSFVQTGSTSQSLTFPSGGISCIASEFNGWVIFSARNILTKTTTYNSAATLTQTSTTTGSNSDGGNTFNGYATIISTGGSLFRLGMTYDDAFLSGLEVSGRVTVAAYNTTTIAESLIADGGDVQFNDLNGYTGTIKFIGNYPYIYSTGIIGFNKIKIDLSTGGYLTLDTTITMDDTLTLVHGNIITTANHLLSMKAGSSVTGASNSSFVEGPVKKIGNTAFIFPTGKGGYYMPIEMSAPSVSTNAYTAEFFNSGQSFGSSMDTSLKYISTTGYWNLARNSGTSNVTVKLNWNTTGNALLDSASVKVANWNASTWKDLGNGGITGNSSAGKVANSSTVVTWGNFTLGYNHCFLTVNAGTDQYLCGADSITIGNSPAAYYGTSPYTYSWSPSTGLSGTSVANPKADPFSTTNYIITVTDNAGCSKKDTVNVIRNPVNYSNKGSDLAWEGVYPKGNESNGYSIQATVDSGYIVCGSVLNTSNNLDIYLVKLNSAGDTTWTKTIGGSGNDVGYSVKQCTDSGFVISGYTTSRGAGGDDIYIVKTNKTGDTLWTNIYGGSSNDISYGVMQSMDGGYVTAGYTASAGAGGLDMIAVKFNASGSVVWNHTYGTAYDETAYSLSGTLDSGFAVCGISAKSTDTSVYVVRIDKSGSVVWDSLYSQTGDQIAYSIYSCEESGFVIAGTTTTTGNGNDMLLMKIFDDGTLLWTQTYGDTGDEVAYDVKETKNYGFVLAGSSTSFGDLNKQSYLVSTDDFGEQLYDNNFGDENDDESRSIIVTEDNSFVLTGNASSICNSPIIVIGGGEPACPISFPRGIWFGGCWDFHSEDNSGTIAHTMLLNNSGGTPSWSSKCIDFADYCLAAKIHTVVLNNLEDLLRQDTLVYNGTSWVNFSGYPPCSFNIDGIEIRNRLQFLIKRLHIQGHVSSVLAQWLDQQTSFYVGCPCCTTAYQADEDFRSHTNSLEILSTFNLFNKPSYVDPLGFDGLMLDYEYFASAYGQSIAGHTAFSDVCVGYKDHWQVLANAFLTAKDNYSTSGVKIVQAFLNKISCTGIDYYVAGSKNFFNYDITSGGASLCDKSLSVGITDIDDSRKEIWEIDNFHVNTGANAKYFNAFALAFDITDLMTPTSVQNNDPTSFLTGIVNGSGGESDLQRARHRLEIFGHETSNMRNTRIIPVLRSQNKTDYNTTNCNTGSAQLGDLMLGGTSGGCYWNNNGSPNPWPTSLNSYPEGPTPYTGDHYMRDIEKEFVIQFYYRYAANSGTDYGYSNYGNTNIYGGFQWFQYGLDADNTLIATSHDALLSGTTILRPGDAVLAVLGCPDAPRFMNPFTDYNYPDSKSSIKEKKDIITIYPNPFSDKAQINFNSDSFMSTPSFRVIDILGRNVSNLFYFAKENEGNHYSITSKDDINGMFFLTIFDGDNQKKVTSFSIMK